jgi:tetratricopeptide (TPR) repeat protein
MLFASAFSQVEKDKPPIGDTTANEFLAHLKMDTVAFLKIQSAEACRCIDSIILQKKGVDQVSKEIYNCIDKQVVVYQMMISLYAALNSEAKKNEISLKLDKNDPGYQRYYFQMERWLKDSCTSLNKAAASDNNESASSISSDPIALEYYYKAQQFYTKENYKESLPWFEKAVKQDAKFAFAWDNIGVCKRKLGDLDGALEACNKSLLSDPKGKTPLLNIPVVYEYKKDYDKALEAYENISKVYPDDPEALFGAGRIYAIKNDIEKALDLMCRAYNAYIKLNAPYRVDAEKMISEFYRKMKDAGKEETFNNILKDNHINSN